MEGEDGQVNVHNLMDKVRMDKHRMLVILLTRLLRKLIMLINESVNPLESPFAK